MKTNSGFILLSNLLVTLLCLLLLSAALLAHHRSLSLYQRERLLDQALTSAQLANAGQETALPTTITHHTPFREIQVLHNAQIVFNLVLYQP